MTDSHPITPPLELVEQWECEYHHMTHGPDLSIFISEKAARWGSDQELEACCEWLSVPCPSYGRELRNARRPKPPSLKEQALALLQPGEPRLFNSEMQDTIRRALEAVDD